MGGVRFWIGALCCVITLCSLPFIGPHTILPQDLLVPESFLYEVFWTMRVPRVLLAFLCGGGLALCGFVLQALFRNDLSSPFTLGVSSASAFGVVVAIGTVGAGAGTHLLVSSLIGATTAAVLLGVLSLSTVSGSVLLLAGLALALFFSSASLLAQYFLDMAGVFQLTRWLMGSFEFAEFRDIALLAGASLCALMVSLPLARELELLAVGEDFALSRGVATRKVRALLIFLVSILTGIIISLCGPIGFVGLIVPHGVKRTFRAPLPLLLLFSFLGGGIFLAACDTISRVALIPYEVPVGIITSLVGVPLFLWIIFSTDERLFR